MWRYSFRRVILTIPTLFAVATFVFFAMRLVPGDPATIMAGDFADAQTLARIRHEWGLDRPLPVQYAVFMGNVLRGDLGRSIRSGLPVTTEILRRFRVTLTVAVASTLVAIVVGGAAGIVGAVRPYSGWDYGSMVFALLGVSTPIFWSGLLLMLLFSLALGWLPTGGIGSARHFVLPALSLGFFGAGVIARQTRSSLLETLGQDYIRTARAKGLSGGRVIFRHALRNSLIPVITVVGLEFGRMLGGAVLTETVFSLPGLGSYLVVSVSQRDYPVVQGIVLFLGASFMVVNLLVDLAYALVNPQARVS